MELLDHINEIAALPIGVLLTMASLFFFFFILKGGIKLQQQQTIMLERSVEALSRIEGLLQKDVPSISDAKYFFKTVLWYASSTGKADAIRRVLIENNIHTREIEIRRNLKSEFQSLTSPMIPKLNQFATGNAPKIGDWFMNNLDWAEFLDPIFDIIFREYRPDQAEGQAKRTEIELRIRDILFYMKGCHERFADKWGHDALKYRRPN